MQVTKVRSLTLALLHNSIRFAILAYVIVVVFWQQSGYQVSEDGVGSVQVDVRGVSFTHWHKDDSDDLDVLKAAGVPRSMRVAGLTCHYHRYYHACGSIVRAYRLDVPVVHLLVRALAVLERVGLGRKAEHRGREAGVLCG